MNALPAVQSSIWTRIHNTILFIDASNNGWYYPTDLLMKTPYLAIIVSNDYKCQNQFHFFLFPHYYSGLEPSHWRPGSRYTLWTCCGGGWKQRPRTSGWTGWSTRWSARPWRRRGPRLDNSSTNRTELWRCSGLWIMVDTTQDLRGTFKFNSRQ